MQETGEVLNLKGAAELLMVSPKTALKLVREGKIPGKKVGREWRFNKQGLLEWLKNGKQNGDK